MLQYAETHVLGPSLGAQQAPGITEHMLSAS